MSSAEQALQLKSEGNALLQAGQFDQAAQKYTEAIALDPNNAVYYSNRSACLVQLHRGTEALSDAEKCIELRPEWSRGFSRKGAALHVLGRFEDAIAAYEDGLKVEPENAALQRGVDEAKMELMRSSQSHQKPGDNPQDLLSSLFSDPKIMELMQDPEVQQMMGEIGQDPSKISQFQSHPKFAEAMQLFQALNPILQQARAGQAEPMEQSDHSPAPAAAPAPKPASKPEPEPEPEPVDPVRAEADALKDEGNKLYKARDFEAALAKYDAAHAVLPSESVYVLNKASVYITMKDYDRALDACEQAIPIAREQGGEALAKVYLRQGNALYAMENLEAALDAYERSVLEMPNGKIRQKINQLKRELKQREKLAYHSEELSDAARERGNAFFLESKFPEAITEYNEAVSRNPKSYKALSNRAAALMKLGDFVRAKDDCEKALEIEPTFVKAMLRLAQCENFFKMYHRSSDLYEKVLTIDPNNQEAKNGQMEVNRRFMESMNAPIDEEQHKRAMADPQIQALLQDPAMHAVLESMQTDPNAAAHHLSNPTVSEQLRKLILAGVLKGGPRQ